MNRTFGSREISCSNNGPNVHHLRVVPYSFPLFDESALIPSREGAHSDDQYFVPEGDNYYHSDRSDLIAVADPFSKQECATPFNRRGRFRSFSVPINLVASTSSGDPLAECAFFNASHKVSASSHSSYCIRLGPHNNMPRVRIPIDFQTVAIEAVDEQICKSTFPIPKMPSLYLATPPLSFMRRNPK